MATRSEQKEESETKAFTESLTMAKAVQTEVESSLGNVYLGLPNINERQTNHANLGILIQILFIIRLSYGRDNKAASTEFKTCC